MRAPADAASLTPPGRIGRVWFSREIRGISAARMRPVIETHDYAIVMRPEAPKSAVNVSPSSSVTLEP